MRRNMPTSKSSRLEAINVILRAVGDTPIASLSGESGVDAVTAAQTLDHVDREIQNIGWRWNRRCITLTRDTDGTIPIPANIVRLDGGRGTHYTVRGQKLFEMVDGTNIFTKDIDVDIVELLVWDDIPQPCRDYITARAARKYADETVTDPQLSQNLRQDEATAYLSLRRHELQTANATVLTNEARRFLDRGSPIQFND